MDYHIDGFVAKGFEPVYEQFKRHFEQGLEHGASVCVQLAGENVVNLWGGYTDRAKSKIWKKDSLVQFFSTTKPMSGLIIAMLQDRGFLSFDDAITDLWPEFAAHGKEITIAEALSHQSGVCGFVNEMDQKLWFDLHKISEMVANAEPLWTPKTRSGYHPMTHGYIANELVYRVLGRDLADVFADDIAAPNEIEFYIGLPIELQNRYVEFLPPREIPNMGEITPIKRAAFLYKWSVPPRVGAEALAAKVPSNNGCGTTEAVASLYGVFANDGYIKGCEVISKATMADFTKSRIQNRDLVIDIDVDWAAGVMRNTTKTFGPSLETMGHAGRGGACGFGDPKKRLSFAYSPNQHSAAIVGDKRANALIKATYDCI